MPDLENFTTQYKRGHIDPTNYSTMWLQVMTMGGGQRDQLEMPKGATGFFGNRKDVNILYDGSSAETCRVSSGGENEMGEINLPSGKSYNEHIVVFQRMGTLDDGFQMLYAPWDGPEAAQIRELSTHRFRLQGKGRQIGFLEQIDPTLIVNHAVPIIHDLLAVYTERTTKQRVGQDLFRRVLIEFWKAQCPFSKIENPRLLRASHIKPWAFCEHGEHRNTHNGFLLSANLDAAFDAGLMTITLDGMIRYSGLLTEADRVRLGVVNEKVNLWTAHHPFLKWHHRHIFKE